MNDLRLEKHFLEDITKKKIAYNKGTSDFEVKYKDKLPSQLFINLQHEAGLAEMYRSDRQLLKYATHCYRQIELIYSTLFESKEQLKKISNQIDWNYWRPKSNWYKKLELNIDKYVNGAKYLSINEKNKDFLFKSIFYFEPKSHNQVLSSNARKIISHGKVYLNAFEALHFYRNVASHNNTDNKSLNVRTKDKSEWQYRENPHLILDSEYFQRYVDMVIQSYQNHLSNPR